MKICQNHFTDDIQIRFENKSNLLWKNVYILEVSLERLFWWFLDELNKMDLYNKLGNNSNIYFRSYTWSNSKNLHHDLDCKRRHPAGMQCKIDFHLVIWQVHSVVIESSTVEIPSTRLSVKHLINCLGEKRSLFFVQCDIHSPICS